MGFAASCTLSRREFDKKEMEVQIDLNSMCMPGFSLINWRDRKDKQSDKILLNLDMGLELSMLDILDTVECNELLLEFSESYNSEFKISILGVTK